MKRFFTAAVLGVLLCAQSGFLMQSRGGEICWRENGTAVWHNTRRRRRLQTRLTGWHWSAGWRWRTARR